MTSSLIKTSLQEQSTSKIKNASLTSRCDCQLVKPQSKIKNQKCPSLLPEPDWLFDEVVTARTAQLLSVASFDGKQAAGVWPVFINAAGCRAIPVLLQKRTFKEQFATGAATIAFTTAQ